MAIALKDDRHNGRRESNEIIDLNIRVPRSLVPSAFGKMLKIGQRNPPRNLTRNGSVRRSIPSAIVFSEIRSPYWYVRIVPSPAAPQLISDCCTITFCCRISNNDRTILVFPAAERSLLWLNAEHDVAIITVAIRRITAAECASRRNARPPSDVPEGGLAEA